MSGQWAIRADDVKKTACRVKSSDRAGSATVEAAIVLPVFLIVLFTLAYIIRIFFAYNSMQTALQSVARDISSASYYYYVSGLKEYSDRLDTMADDASDVLNSQKEAILASIDSFNNMITSAGGIKMDPTSDPDEALESMENLCQSGLDVADNVKKAVDLVKEIIKDPKAEGKLLLTVFAQKAAYTARKGLVCLIAGCMLDSELDKKALMGINAKSTLGIDDISFSQSQIFGDSESLEFIITYTVKPPGIFGLVPKMTLSNRVKLVAWTGGRGQSVRTGKEETKPADDGSSVWTAMDNDKKYWDRGLEIEKLQCEELQKDAAGRNMNYQKTDIKFPAVDAFIYNDTVVEVYDVFTLNPLKPTYKSQPGKIKAEIKKHGKRLKEFDFGDFAGEVPQGSEVKRVIICIVPENTPDISAYFDAAKEELLKIGITDVRLVKGYGSYDETMEEEVKEAS